MAREGIRGRLLSKEFLRILADASLPRLTDADRFTEIDLIELRGDPKREVSLVQSKMGGVDAAGKATEPSASATIAHSSSSSSSSSSAAAAGEAQDSSSASGSSDAPGHSPGVLLLSFIHSCVQEAAVADVAAESIHEMEDAHAAMVAEEGEHAAASEAPAAKKARVSDSPGEVPGAGIGAASGAGAGGSSSPRKGRVDGMSLAARL